MAEIPADLWWRAYGWTIAFLIVAIVASIAWAVAFLATRRKPFLVLLAGFGTNAVSNVIQVAIDFVFFFLVRSEAGMSFEEIIAEQQAWGMLFQVLHAIFYGSVILAAALFWREGKVGKRQKPVESKPEKIEW